MVDQPLQPFAPPSGFAEFLPNGVLTTGTFVSWFLYLALFIWLCYTIVAVYHWLKYSHASLVAIPAIALHLVMSFILITFAVSGAIFI